MMFTIVFSALIQAGPLAAAPGGSAQAHVPRPTSRDAGVGLTVEDYQALFERGLADIFKGKVAGKFVPEDLPEGFPKHVVFGVSGAGRSAPMFLATNGVGRLPQPNSVEADDNQNVELTTFADGFDSTACRILSYLGRALSLHEKGESAGKGFDTVKLFEPILGFQHFVFRPSGHIQVSGRTVTLLAVIPLTEAEYRQAANGKAREWLEQKMADPEQRNDFVARWSKPKGKL